MSVASAIFFYVLTPHKVYVFSCARVKPIRICHKIDFLIMLKVVRAVRTKTLNLKI